MIQLF